MAENTHLNNTEHADCGQACVLVVDSHPGERPVHILLVEDSQEDAERIVNALREEGCCFIFERIGSESDLRGALASRGWDIVLSDYDLAGLSARDVVAQVRADPRGIPLIVVSSCIGEEEAVTLMKSGVSDVIPKGNLARLLPALGRELREAEVRRRKRKAICELAEQERFLRDITSALYEGIVVLDTHGRLLFMNPEAERLLGWREVELLGLPMHEVVPCFRADGSSCPVAECPAQLLQRDGDRWRGDDVFYICKDGQALPVSCVITRITGQDGSIRYIQAFQDRTDRQQADEELQASRRQLRELSAFLQRVREEERTHIARELHDELGQLLSGLRMDVDWLQRQLAGGQRAELAKLRSMTQLIDTTLRSVRRISTDLRPAVLDDFGPEAAIEWLVDSFRARSGVSCNLRLDLGGEVLAEPVATAVFRLAQESLTNVCRHAGAQRVDIALSLRDGVLGLEVRDDGVGFQPDGPQSRSFGLIGMRERVLALNGCFKVNSRPGEGTVIRVEIPLAVSRNDGLGEYLAVATLAG